MLTRLGSLCIFTLLAVGAPAAMIACGSSSDEAKASDSPGTSAAAATAAVPSLLWHNLISGEIIARSVDPAQINASTSYQTPCSGSDAGSQCRAVSTFANSVLVEKLDSVSTASIWTLPPGGGSVVASPWRPVAYPNSNQPWMSAFLRFDAPTFFGPGSVDGIFWTDRNASNVSVSELGIYGSFTENRPMSCTSTMPDACTSGAEWRVVTATDCDADKTSDIVWFNSTTHALRIWYLADSAWLAPASVKSVAFINPPCDASSSLCPLGTPFGAADVNGDGHTDVSFWDSTTRQVQTWFLSESAVIDTATVDYSNDSALTHAKPIGYITYPSQ